MKKIFALLIGLAFCTMNAIAAVNINTATQAQLETLNGIGPAKAKAIIDYRAKNGSFKTVEELDKVPGIGEGVMAKIKADVTLSGETTVKVADKKAAKEEKKADDKKAAKEEKKADDKKVAKEEKKADDKKAAADKKADDKKAAEDKKAADKKAAEDKKAADKKAKEDKKAADKK
ncbi:MAG: hypothetical protein H6R18_1314 [Proteobacteria bacterium]|nr:hypothetical protein [Pseudomonadota bacterium]